MNVQTLNRKKIEPTLIISSKLYTELLQQVRSTDLETTFILHIEKENDNEYKVINYYFPPQWNEPAESKTLDSDYPKWCFELVKSQIKLNGHLHTHPKFSVTPSGYDNSFFGELTKETNSFQFRLIMNQEGCIHCDLIDAINNLIFTSIPVTVTCRGFNLIINDRFIRPNVINFNDMIINVNPDLSFDILDKYLTYNSITQKIKTVETLKTLIKTTRRNQTNEAITYTNFNKPINTFNNNKYTEKQMSIFDFPLDDEEPWGTQDEIDAYDEYLKYYDMEHGY